VTVSGRRDTPAAEFTVSRDGHDLHPAYGDLTRRDPSSLRMCNTATWHDLPMVVLVAVERAVDRFVVTTREGRELEVALSPPHPRTGQRFGVETLPEGSDIGSAQAETAGRIVYRKP
jgi:hypothetical protein